MRLNGRCFAAPSDRVERGQPTVSNGGGMKWLVPSHPIELEPEGSFPCLEFQSLRAAIERGIQHGKQLVETFTINLWVGMRHGLAPLAQGRMTGEVEYLVAPVQQAFPQDIGIPCCLDIFSEVVSFMRDSPRLR